MSLLLETTYGDLVIDLSVESSPELCRNILKLACARFYTQSLVYSIDRDQGLATFGCPFGNGTGGASIYGYLDAMQRRISVEESKQRFLKSSAAPPITLDEFTKKGRLMAVCINGVADTFGSQLMLTLTDDDERALTDEEWSQSTAASHPRLLGVVAEDNDQVLVKLAAAYTDKQGRPFIDIRIQRCRVIYDPFDDPPGMNALLQAQGIRMDDSNQRALRSPSPERPSTEVVPLRLSSDEVMLDDQDDPDAAAKRYQLEQQSRRREDQSRTTMLELLGDLPPTEAQTDSSHTTGQAVAPPIAPPDTVLFICKLNPVTTAEDLELIFSRFDTNVRVDLLKDEQTLQSLQYAFAHFHTPQQATEAYLKMNQALVDDRRIIVDFCQSVSHVWDKYRQRFRTHPKGTNLSTIMPRGHRDDVSNNKRREHGQGGEPVRGNRDSSHDMQRDVSSLSQRQGNSQRYQVDRSKQQGNPRFDDGNYENQRWQQPNTDEFGRLVSSRQRGNGTMHHGDRQRYENDDHSPHEHGEVSIRYDSARRSSRRDESVDRRRHDRSIDSHSRTTERTRRDDERQQGRLGRQDSSDDNEDYRYRVQHRRKRSHDESGSDESELPHHKKHKKKKESKRHKHKRRHDRDTSDKQNSARQDEKVYEGADVSVRHDGFDRRQKHDKPSKHERHADKKHRSYK
ncbi:hypothetical protein MPSEU_000149300 [Mayamaea pseudoterrestris]|nr:hypothetical protein MPSEU_000149300 [Mayamaea pseudoterrestris]